MLLWLRSKLSFGRVLVGVFLLTMFGLFGTDWSGWATIGTYLLFIFMPFLCLWFCCRSIDGLFGQRR